MKEKPTRGRLVRGTRPDWMIGTGPYLGKIVNHLDPEYMGTVEVEILKIFESGNPDEGSGYIVPCTYVSPFYGVSPRQGVSANDGFDNTQKSYGMWAIPPDIGVKVLVLMIENNYGHGYWIGCVQDRFMNFMLPGYPSTGYNDTQKGKIRPVGEYNKSNILNKPSGKGTDPTQFEKPINDDALKILETQGLIDDQTRGTNTSSARREVPSMVFGISTPGILDRRGGKNKVLYGELATKTNIPFSRLGGTSFIMDDGDATLHRKGSAAENPSEYANFETGDKSGDPTIPHNELTKWRTRTGHQILMHNSEDLIYIGNARGTAWIELTSNGKIDIYSKDSVSVYTENDINFKAERDFNFEAMRNINIKAHNEIYIESGEMTNMKIGTNPDGNKLFIETSLDTHVKTGTHSNKGNFFFESTLETDFLVGSNLTVKSVEKTHVKAGTNMYLEAVTDIHQKSGKNFYILAGNQLHEKASTSIFSQSGTDTNIKSGTNLNLQSGTSMNLKSGQHLNLSSAVNIKLFATANNLITAGLTNNYKGLANKFSPPPSGGAASAAPAAPASPATAAQPADEAVPAIDAIEAFIPIRIPKHEPWTSHENLKPLEFTPEKTDSVAMKGSLQAEIPFTTVVDTFRKGK